MKMALGFTPPTVEEAIEATGMSTDSWYHNCHAASLALVRSGILPAGARVARGSAVGVGGQHSWVSIGHPYGLDSQIIDITRWSYINEAPEVWTGNLLTGLHLPHGIGFLEDWQSRPRPESYDNIIRPDKDAYTALSSEAKMFFAMLGSLDFAGWCWLMRQGMQGWPSGEIIDLMKKTPDLSALVPIDLEGMLTDRNPSNLYF